MGMGEHAFCVSAKERRDRCRSSRKDEEEARDGAKVQMVEISGNKAGEKWCSSSKRGREKEREERKRTAAFRGGGKGGRFSFFSCFFSKTLMGRETRKVSSTWWLSGPVVVTVPSGGGVSGDDGGST